MTVLAEGFRYALRLVRRKPGFAALVVLILAIGIGANTAMFSLVNGILIQPLEYPESRQLYRLFHMDLRGTYQRSSVTPGNFYDWARQTDSFQSMAAYFFMADSLTGRGEPQRLVGTGMAGDLFEVLGVPPLLGRTFRPEEQDQGSDPTVVISYSAWQRFFGGAQDVLGQTFVLDDNPYTVIGVMPAEFRFPSPSVNFWVTARWDEEFRDNRYEYFLRVLARLKRDVSRQTAAAELETVMSRLRSQYPEENDNVAVNLVPMHEEMVTDVRSRLLILMGAVAMVLVIACVNMANLFLARAASRGHEIALRQALGAGRGRVALQALSEAVLLGLMGAAAGLLLGWTLLRLIMGSVLGNLPRLEAVGIDFSVFAFTAFVGVFSGLLFGLLPALHQVRVSPVHALKERLRSGGSRRLRALLVISEVALALVLLAGAGLLIRSLAMLQQVDPGVNTERLLTFRISLPSQKYDLPARERFFREACRNLRALPGVVSAAATTTLPATGWGNGAWFNIVGRPVPEGKMPPGVRYRIVTPGYFEMMGISLLKGRLLTESDRRDSSPSVVVNQELADRFFPDEDPLGHEVVLGPLEEEVINPPSRIVGVVRNVRSVRLDEDYQPVVYLPHAVTPQWNSLAFVVRAAGEPLSLLPSVRASVAEMDPALPLFGVSTAEAAISETLTPTRSAMILLGSFAAVALVMAVVGVFGVLSYNVSLRRRELGIRVALGADRRRIFGLVLREGLAQTALGMGLGLVGCLGLTRLMAGMLFGVSPLDPMTLAGVSVCLSLAALLACSIPARRAGRLDPIRSLRKE